MWVVADTDVVGTAAEDTVADDTAVVAADVRNVKG